MSPVPTRLLHILLIALACMDGCEDLEPDLFPGFDEPPPADADLTGYRRPVLAEDNGFAWLDMPPEDVHWPDDDEDVQGASATFDPARAREVVERNQAVLERLEAARRRRRFQAPEPQAVDDRVPHLLTWRSIAFVVSCRARLLEESGDVHGAMEEAFRLLELGHVIEGSQGPAIGWLVGAATRWIALSHVVRLVANGDLGAEEWRGWAAGLEGLGPCRACLGEAFQAEYVLLGNSLTRLAGGDFAVLDIEDSLRNRIFTSVPFLKPNQTKRLLAAEVRELSRKVSIPYSDRPASDVEARYAAKKRWSWFLANSMGKTSLAGAIAFQEKSIVEADKGDWFLAAVRTLLALKAYQAARGALPGDLEALVPDFLDHVPLDPFAAEPLRYSAEKKLIYSAGMDREDQGGSAEADDEDAFADFDEPTLRIRF